ncbi:MAG: multiheme c-type cytochrome [bacterium]
MGIKKRSPSIATTTKTDEDRETAPLANSWRFGSFMVLFCLFFFLTFSGFWTWFFPTWSPGYNAVLLMHLYLGVICMIVFTYYLIKHIRQTAEPRDRNLPVWILLDFIAMFVFLDPPGTHLENISRILIVALFVHVLYCAIRFTLNQIRKENKVVVILGFFSAFFFFSTAFLGLLNLFGNITFPSIFLNGHRYLSIVFTAIMGFHIYYSLREKQALDPARIVGIVRRVAAAAVVGLVLLVLIYPFSGLFVTPPEEMREYEVSGIPTPEKFSASNMKLSSRNLPTPALMADSKSCGDHAGCHSDIFVQWESSTHRLGGNRLVRALIQRAIDEEGMGEGSFCIGCHVPASAVTGRITHDFFNQKDETIFEGSSCVVCHGVSAVSPIGNISFTIDPPFGWIQAGPKPSEQHKLFISNILLILSKPDFHNRLFRRKDPIYRSSEYCATCHENYSDTPSGRLHPQDLYQSWIEWKWKTGKEDTCNDCHMPVFIDHVGNPIKSHRFLGGNQALTMLTADWKDFIRPKKIKKLPGVSSNRYYPESGTEAQDLANEAYLKGDVEIKKVWYEGYRRRERIVLEKGPNLGVDIMVPDNLGTGDSVEVVVVTKNLKIGHTFPSGDLQVLQTWLDFKVTDSQGEEIYRNGYLDDKFFLDPQAHRMGRLCADADGEPIRDGRVWRAKSSIYYRVILPAGEIEDKYKFVIPEHAAGPLTITATWRYRRANQHVTNAVFGPDSGVTLPVTDMVSVSKTAQLQ